MLLVALGRRLGAGLAHGWFAPRGIARLARYFVGRLQENVEIVREHIDAYLQTTRQDLSRSLIPMSWWIGVGSAPLTPM